MKIPHDGLPKDHMWKVVLLNSWYFITLPTFSEKTVYPFAVIFDQGCGSAREDFVPISLIFLLD